MLKNKILEKLLAIVLIFTLTFANFAFVTKSYAGFVETLFGGESSTGNKNVEFEAYFGTEDETSVISDVNNNDVKLNLMLNVQKSGYLKDAKIEFAKNEETGKLNFEVGVQEKLPDYVRLFENNTIYLNQIDTESEVKMEVPIEYKNEEYVSEEKAASESKVVFTGTYVNEEGEEEEVTKEENEYSNIFKGKNVIAIHAESIQNYLLSTEINGKELTPNLKRLASEGMYFSNFYSQESVGTSSDSEFTYSTSLLPASSGTVFVSYWDREYPSIQKFLKEENYYVFSMHANKGNFWNREVMHKKLGYDKFYYYDKDYKLDDIVGMGLSDKSFFKQSVPKIKKISSKYDKFYGLLIMLSNHTPFDGIGDNTDLDLTYHYTKTNEDGTTEEVTNNYLKGTTLGKYFTTAHYADSAIGEFVEEMDKEGLWDNTILVIYGDHDAKIKRNEYDYYYNYNPETDSKRSKDDPEYKEFTKYDYEINRKVPFIIWTKDEELRKKINKEITTVTGMYDVLPTLGNMLGIKDKYALGHDVFSTDDHYVIFPNGNWITDKMYYDNQNGQAVIFDENAVISSDYISKYSKKAEDAIAVSNDIIVHDLVKKTEESNKVIKGGQK